MFQKTAVPVREDVVTTLLTMTNPSSTMSVSSIDDRPPTDGGRLPKLPRLPTARPASHTQPQLAIELRVKTVLETRPMANARVWSES